MVYFALNLSKPIEVKVKQNKWNSEEISSSKTSKKHVKNLSFALFWFEVKHFTFFEANLMHPNKHKSILLVYKYKNYHIKTCLNFTSTTYIVWLSFVYAVLPNFLPSSLSFFSLSAVLSTAWHKSLHSKIFLLHGVEFGEVC